jgi:ABC-2 type transport system ATP-binding protein
MILGLRMPSAGEVRVLGHDMARDRHRALACTNFSPPYVDLPKRLTVAQNLGVYALLNGVPDRRARIAALARDLAFTDLLARPCGTVSAGQRSRVHLGKALLNRPEVLLLDEPTASLDPDAADLVRSYLERYRRESRATILLASHNMREAERLCDDVAMLRRGRLVDRGSPATLIARHGGADLEQVFLDIARDPTAAAAN